MKLRVLAVVALAVAVAIGVVVARRSGEVALLADAKLSLQEAINKAVAEVPGGVVVKAELEKEDGRVVFSMDVAKGAAIVELHIDPATGAIVAREDEKGDASDLATGKVRLADAVAKALALRPGRATSAEIERKRDALVAEVEVVGGDGKHAELEVDLASGTVTEE